MPRNTSQRRHNVPAARELRERETPAERLLWNVLRGRQVAGLKFRRQHPIGPFVAGFCCPERRLILEVDGGIHETQQDRDAEREALLRAAGYHVLRVTNEAVLTDLASVLTLIHSTAETLPQSNGTPPYRTGGL